jgi:preprotein translocase subunit SecF
LALNQTLVRSINTSFVALIPVGSVLAVGIFILGPGTLRDIALALFVGMLVGAYSSIFLATPMAVSLTNVSGKTKQHNELVFKKRAAAISELSELKDGEELDPTKTGTPSEIDLESIAQNIETPVVQLMPGKHLGNKAIPKSKKKRKKTKKS